GVEGGPRAIELAAPPIDLAQVHQRARLARPVRARAHRFEVALEVRLGAIELAAPKERHTDREIDVLAELLAAGAATGRAEVHQRIGVLPRFDELLGERDLERRLGVARRRLFDGALELVQSLLPHL